MGYPNFGKVKTITLPLDYNFIDEHDGELFVTFARAYKEKYGIDLNDLIVFDTVNKSIYLKGGIFYLLQVDGTYHKYDTDGNTILPYSLSPSDSQYEQGSVDAHFYIAIADPSASNAGYGLLIYVAKEDATFSKDNARITIYDI